MGKGIPVVALILVLAYAFASPVPAQEGISQPNFISGTITRIDPEKKEIAVQDKDGEMSLQWNQETRINGSPAGKAEAILAKLKTGMAVTVFFAEVDRNRIANRIEVEEEGLGVLKGWEDPFTCGTSVC